MNLPAKILDRAKEIYKEALRVAVSTPRLPHNAAAQVQEKHSTRVRSVETLAATTLYIACRYNGVPRTQKGASMPPLQTHAPRHAPR